MTAEQCYGRATSFMEAGRLLSEREKETEGFVIIPMISCWALAAELFLKCIIVLETGNFQGGHNLADLFAATSRQTRKQVSREWNRRHGTPAIKADSYLPNGSVAPRDLAGNLALSANAFVDFRYYSEFALWGLNSFPELLWERIGDLKPDWRKNAPNPMGAMLSAEEIEAARNEKIDSSSWGPKAAS